VYGAGSPPWNVGAASLGLALHEPMGPYEQGASFARLKRALGAVAPPPPRFHQWMYGKRRATIGTGDAEVEVIAVLANVTDGVDTKSFVHAVARIDPPLMTGLALTRRFGPYPAPIGEPRLDHSCAVQALAPSYLVPLFRQDIPEATQLLDAIDRLSPWGFQIGDSTVDVFARHAGPPPLDLGARIEAAVAVAALIGKLRARVPPLPGEEQRVQTWQAFADASRLELDRTRMVLRGEVHGAKVQIRIEGEASGLQTVLVLELPQALGIGLQLTRQSALQAIADFFGPTDIRVGDPIFDDLFLIKGNVERVRWIFQSHELRRALVELVSAARDILMDDGRLFVRWPMPVDDPQHLAGIVYRARAIVGALFPAAPAPGPYR
jgi:hypothetical protein